MQSKLNARLLRDEMPRQEKHRLTIQTMIGSLRQDSLNRRLFASMIDMAPPGLALCEVPIGGLPLFNEDLESHPPPAVETFREAIRGSHGILFITPEYNYSLPGVLKNAIDWASWPPQQGALYGKPGAIVGASAGRSGTMRCQLHLRQVLSYLDMKLVTKPEVFVTFAGEKFDADGRLTDESIRAQISELLLSFEEWIRLLRS